MSILTLNSRGDYSASSGGLNSRALQFLALATMGEIRASANKPAHLTARSDAADDDADKKAFGKYWSDVQDALYSHVVPDVRHGIRADGFDASAGATAPDANLTALMWRVIPQVQPKQNSREFQKSSTLAPGLQMYQLAYEGASGEAQLWSGGAGQIQPLAAGWSFVNRRQYHFITEEPVMVVEQATFAAMGSNLRDALRRQAVLAHSLVDNRLCFQGGGGDLDLWGLKNYPTLAIDYTGLSIASVTGATLARAISDTITAIQIDSKQAIEVDTLMLPTKMMPLWATLYPGGTGSDVTLADWFASAFPSVRIVWANELNDLLASGVHAMFAYQSRGPSAPTLEGSPVIYLPEYQRGVGVSIYAYHRYGGMVLGHTVGARIAAIED